MQHFDWKILPLLFLLFSCNNKQAPENQLFVYVEQVSLRSEPSEKSPEILSLRKGRDPHWSRGAGTVWNPNGRQMEVFQTPWIKVQTGEHQAGWVLAWALRPANDKEDWLLEKRLACYFGKALAARRNSVVQNFSTLETEAQFAEMWRATVALRDTFFVSAFPPPSKWVSTRIQLVEWSISRLFILEELRGRRAYARCGFSCLASEIVDN